MRRFNAVARRAWDQGLGRVGWGLSDSQAPPHLHHELHSGQAALGGGDVQRAAPVVVHPVGVGPAACSGFHVYV